MAGRLNAADLLGVNQAFYDALWSHARLVGPHRFATWDLVRSLPGRRLELGPGLRPRLPVAGTVVLDISLPALRPLARAGARAVAASASALPFANASFDVLCAMDVVEHVMDDAAAMAELARVAAPGAVLLLCVPLHQRAWTGFDVLVGHARRYEPAALAALLRAHGWGVERSAIAGLRPRSGRLVSFGMWCLLHGRQHAMWWFNHVFMPLGLRRAKPLAWSPGLVTPDAAGGVLLVCRLAGRPTPS